MGSPRKPRVSAEKRRELQVAAAVAREALLQTHVHHALELIDLAGNRVSVMRMLSIYVRVNLLAPPDAELVTTRVLAQLGDDAHTGDMPLVFVEGEATMADSLPLVGVVRDRLRGRALNDLRTWVELHTGRTQIALLDVYVQHGLRFVELLRDSHPVAAALRVYAEFVSLPRMVNDVLHIFVLERLAGDGLPGGRGVLGAAGPRALRAAARLEEGPRPGTERRASGRRSAGANGRSDPT